MDFSQRVVPSFRAADFTDPAISPGETKGEIGLMLALARKDGTWIIMCKMPIATTIFPKGLKLENKRMAIIFNSPTQTNVQRLTSTHDLTKPEATPSVSGVAKKTRNMGANIYCAVSSAVWIAFMISIKMSWMINMVPSIKKIINPIVENNPPIVEPMKASAPPPDVGRSVLAINAVLATKPAFTAPVIATSSIDPWSTELR
jgi:hypothetical protein